MGKTKVSAQAPDSPRIAGEAGELAKPKGEQGVQSASDSVAAITVAKEAVLASPASPELQRGEPQPPAERGPTKVEKKAKGLERGRVYINASYNNTTVTVTDGAGNVVAWASAGSLGFAGPKKATPFASSKVIAAIGEKLKSAWPASLEVIVKGIGSGRDSAVRSLINHGCNIVSMKDVTPIPHNGPRRPKIRRV